MSNTLYDLLEVNQSASQDAIAAAYKRLHSKMAGEAGAGNEDATNQLIAIREAYNTLSDLERRRRYDERLAARQAAPVVAETGTRPIFKLFLVAIVLAACGVVYAKYQSEQEKARLERERIVAEAKAAELAIQKEREAKQAADEAERQRLRNEAMERYNRERDLAYANRVSSNLQYSEAQVRREQEREEQQRANTERQQRYEAERQLAKDKAYLRQLEAENQRYRRY